MPDTSASAPGAPPRRPARDPRGGNFLRPRRILRQIGRRKLSKGYQWLRAMQDAGDLPKHGGDRKSSAEPRRLILDDLIAHQRAAEWAALAKLTEHQLDAAERIANEEDPLLSRDELIKLSKAGTPMPTKEPRARSARALKIIEQAREQYAGDNIQIDDDAKITHTERGAWVAGWVWVEDMLTRSDLDE